MQSVLLDGWLAAAEGSLDLPRHRFDAVIHEDCRLGLGRGHLVSSHADCKAMVGRTRWHQTHAAEFALKGEDTHPDLSRVTGLSARNIESAVLRVGDIIGITHRHETGFESREDRLSSRTIDAAIWPHSEDIEILVLNR